MPITPGSRTLVLILRPLNDENTASQQTWRPVCQCGWKSDYEYTSIDLARKTLLEHRCDRTI